ncbi:MAG: HD domain-containing protein [Candidatus Omnitrophica bacterium]|nr:HD domain-containing protein [Candidatus Omnitrophota bacterium]
MSAAVNFRIRSIAGESLLKKFALAFIFMSLVPLVLLMFMIYLMMSIPYLREELKFLNLTIVLVVLLSVASFELVRRSIISLIKFTRMAKDIAAGHYEKRIDVDARDEVGFLEKSFNKITGELEDKIRELESSKALLHDILQKIGMAVTSSKGIGNLLELIIQSLVKGEDAASGAIFLLDESKKQMAIRTSFGMDEGTEGISLEADRGLASKVFASRKSQAASEISVHPVAAYEFGKGLAKDSLLMAPLLYKDEILGVIVICDKEKGPFSNDDIILLGNVASQTAVAIKNLQLNEDAEKTYIETITALAMAVEAKDPYSKGHLDRVADYVEKLGRQMKLDEITVKDLKNGSILHDVGKIGIRDNILKKEDSLDPQEEKEMQDHVVIGVNIIRPIRSMAGVCELVRCHQEEYDGSGYPDGLKREEIPLAARILKVCDTYDAMTTDRPYRKAMSREQAIKELKAKSGEEFDPKVVEEFLKII